MVNGIYNTITIRCNTMQYDGRKIKITHTGTVKLNECITLRSVMFVPEFQFNLISITKLCDVVI